MRARTGIVVGSAADGGSAAVTSSVNVHTHVSDSDATACPSVVHPMYRAPSAYRCDAMLAAVAPWAAVTPPSAGSLLPSPRDFISCTSCPNRVATSRDHSASWRCRTATAVCMSSFMLALDAKMASMRARRPASDVMSSSPDDMSADYSQNGVWWSP